MKGMLPVFVFGSTPIETGLMFERIGLQTSGTCIPHQRPTKKPRKWPSSLPRALPGGIGATRRRNRSTALRYSAATGDATLGELAECDPEVDEPFAPGALISSSGLSERRDFPSK